jgi:hypothetical protein
VSGPVYDTAGITADQLDTAPSSQQMLAFGSEPTENGDAPLPLWAYVALGLALFAATSLPLRPRRGATGKRARAR